ncbi:outer membrane beta-barrel protein [Massilia agilis]|uniref:Outer membrane beta-barrel protein n=1 Tax=Massilia agilis TaxID=1811226 RepID=A0ABT2DF96_9BURK|nr:outer membrane beta-barrel protein [Massilia agilis]MCS0809980.1 outer membrane beta-barrel protein [Massilia agilis]
MIKKILAAAALATLAASSQAAGPGTTYAGVDVGATHIKGDSNQVSYGAFLGYNFNQNFAGEIGVRRLWSDTQDWNEARMDQIAVSAIGSLPVNAATSVYGRVGYNRLNAKVDMGKYGSVSDNTSGLLLGVGVKYDFDSNISGRVELQRPHSDVLNLSAGISYAF